MARRGATNEGQKRYRHGNDSKGNQVGRLEQETETQRAQQRRMDRPACRTLPDRQQERSHARGKAECLADGCSNADSHAHIHVRELLHLARECRVNRPTGGMPGCCGSWSP